jgi:hypothetical protein
LNPENYYLISFIFYFFADKKEVELVWNGKTSEVSNVVLPFQTIELVDEPRAESTQDTKKQAQQMLFDFDDRGRQIAGWTNKLIWGDNKLILSSLKSGVMREEIDFECIIGSRYSVIDYQLPFSHSSRYIGSLTRAASPQPTKPSSVSKRTSSVLWSLRVPKPVL